MSVEADSVRLGLRRKGRGIRMRKTERGICIFTLCGIILTGCAGTGYDREVKTDAAYIMSEKEYGKFDWPKSELASLIPEPEFDSGRVEWETDYGFAVSVEEIPEQEFNKYAAACYQKGFNVNYRKGSAFFYADNKEGCHLILKARENDIMYVRLEREHRHRNG